MTDSPQNNNFLQRLRQRLSPPPYPTDDRSRMRAVMDSLALHLHPAKIPASTLRWTYTWGLGGLSALLIVLLAFTGILLQMNYTPSPPQAYLDILNLRANVRFGDLIRNLHHWSANLLVITAVLHLLRVFFTGGHRHPRELNWLLGVAMLLLTLAANFTGYLLPWDQLAYWAITVGTSILGYIPLIGGWLSRLLLGGPEVGAPTLLNFYALHISIIPLSIVMLMSYHFWRVRKDGGLTMPRNLDGQEETRIERVTTIPYLVRREAMFAMVWLAILLVWAALVPAPLEGIANPQISPNPAKAPWYFLGIQELLLHFHPFVAAVLIPAGGLSALALLPFYDVTPEGVGIYFRSRRGRGFSLLAASLAIFLVPTWVVADEFLLRWSDWLPNWSTLLSEGLVPLALVLLGLMTLDELLKKLLKANAEERILFFFVFFFVGLILLTLVGIYFRGHGMTLMFPWDIH